MVKQQEENGVAEEKVYTIRLINKIFLGFIIVLFIFTIAGAAKPNPQYKDFQAKVETTLTIYEPLVRECKFDKKGVVTVYFNPYVYDTLTLDQIDEYRKQIRSIIKSSAIASEFKKDGSVSVVFKH